MAVDNDNEDRDRDRTAEPAKDKSISQKTKASGDRGARRPVSPGVGNALREAYQEALREEVPPEMLDLLGKLG